jgi:hypothetical protein
MTSTPSAGVCEDYFSPNSEAIDVYCMPRGRAGGRRESIWSPQGSLSYSR